MMPTLERTAEANWKGNFEEGHGLTTTEHKALVETRYSCSSRFEATDDGTNPEELIASAAASCFSMALSKTLSDAGRAPSKLRTRATIGMRKDDEGVKISTLHLHAEGTVPGIDEKQFRQYAEDTRAACPVWQLLAPGLDQISLETSFPMA